MKYMAHVVNVSHYYSNSPKMNSQPFQRFPWFHPQSPNLSDRLCQLPPTNVLGSVYLMIIKEEEEHRRL